MVDFTDEHRQALLAVAPDLVKLPPEQADAAWGEWASKYYKVKALYSSREMSNARYSNQDARLKIGGNSGRMMCVLCT